MPNHQLKLFISDELLVRLEKARKRFGKRTPQTVVVEVVEDYLYLWEAAEQSRQRHVARQQKLLLKKLQKSKSQSKKPVK